MIVTCPVCQTRYTVDDATLGGAGRRVRCAGCGNLWHYSPEPAAIRDSVAGVSAEAVAAAPVRALLDQPAPPAPSFSAEAPRAEPRIEAQPQPAGPTVLPRPSVAAESPLPSRRRRAGFGILGLLLLITGILLAAILARDDIVAMWPEAAPIYTKLGLIAPPGAGLDVTVSPTRTADSLVIDGNIVNSASVARRVPRLRVALRDDDKVELDFKVIDPPVETLSPGAAARFNTVFERPSMTATGVAVTFVSQ